VKQLFISAFLLAGPALASDLCSNTSLFTPEQVKSGGQYFNSSCGMCHQYDLSGRTPGNAANENPNNFESFPDFYIKFMDGAGGSVPALIGAKWMGKFKSFPEFMLYAPSAANTPQFYPPLAPKGGAEWVQTQLRLAAYILYRNCEAGYSRVESWASAPGEPSHWG
jgi:hypothetical protein